MVKNDNLHVWLKFNQSMQCIVQLMVKFNYWLNLLIFNHSIGALLKYLTIGYQKSIRKYDGRTITLEKLNYKTSKIAWGTSMTSWTFLVNWRNWIIYIHVWDTNHSFHTWEGVIFFLNYYSWKILHVNWNKKKFTH